MVFEPIGNKKISSQIIEQIKENILDGKLKVGDKLPSERELSQTLGISRASVREAIRSLDVLGVVVSIQGEGTFIQGDFHDSLCMLMTFMYCMNGCKLDEALQLREALELQSIIHSIDKWEEKDIKELEQYCDLLETVESEEKKSEYDKKFHDKIAEMSGNTLILTILNSASYIIQHIIKNARERILFRDCIQEITKQHRQILAAIQTRDVTAVEKNMKFHMNFIKQAFQENITNVNALYIK